MSRDRESSPPLDQVLRGDEGHDGGDQPELLGREPVPVKTVQNRSVAIGVVVALGLETGQTLRADDLGQGLGGEVEGAGGGRAGILVLQQLPAAEILFRLLAQGSVVNQGEEPGVAGRGLVGKMLEGRLQPLAPVFGKGPAPGRSHHLGQASGIQEPGPDVAHHALDPARVPSLGPLHEIRVQDDPDPFRRLPGAFAEGGAGGPGMTLGGVPEEIQGRVGGQGDQNPALGNGGHHAGKALLELPVVSGGELELLAHGLAGLADGLPCVQGSGPVRGEPAYRLLQTGKVVGEELGSVPGDVAKKIGQGTRATGPGIPVRRSRGKEHRVVDPEGLGLAIGVEKSGKDIQVHPFLGAVGPGAAQVEPAQPLEGFAVRGFRTRPGEHGVLFRPGAGLDREHG